jgi:Uma2 family endonuclease
MPAPTGLITAEQLERRPEDLARGELVAGRFVPMTPVGFEHGRVVCRLLFLLARHLEGHNLGVAVTEVGLTPGPPRVYRCAGDIPLKVSFCMPAVVCAM